MKLFLSILTIIVTTVANLVPALVKGIKAISDSIESAQTLVVAGALGISFTAASIVLAIWGLIKKCFR